VSPPLTGSWRLPSAHCHTEWQYRRLSYLHANRQTETHSGWNMNTVKKVGIHIELSTAKLDTVRLHAQIALSNIHSRAIQQRRRSRMRFFIGFISGYCFTSLQLECFNSACRLDWWSGNRRALTTPPDSIGSRGLLTAALACTLCQLLFLPAGASLYVDSLSFFNRWSPTATFSYFSSNMPAARSIFFAGWPTAIYSVE